MRFAVVVSLSLGLLACGSGLPAGAACERDDQCTAGEFCACPGGATAPVCTAGPFHRCARTGPDGCPDGMVALPAGTFRMGSLASEGINDEHQDEMPHRVTLHAFCLDRREVTLGEWRACAAGGGCPEAAKTIALDTATEADVAAWSPFCNAAQADRDGHPANCVDWSQAAAFCAWRDGRLPTEAEWEYGARGPQSSLYPWGAAEPDGTRANVFDEDAAASFTEHGSKLRPMFAGSDGAVATAAVGSYPAGRTASGLDDMAGNVSEWVADVYADYPFGDATDPQGPATGALRVVRGGGWTDDESVAIRGAARFSYAPNSRAPYIGFRCARSLP